MAGERCLFKHCLNDRREPLKAAAQIRESGGNPDPCPRLQLDHRNRLPKTVRTSSGSTPASTLITARPGSSIWIDPDRAMTGANLRPRDTARLCSHGHRHQPGSGLVGEHRGFPCDTRIATGTPGSHLPHAHEPLAQSTLPGQTWLLRSDASPPVSFATASGKRPCLNCNRIAHKVIVGQIKPPVYTVKSGRLQTHVEVGNTLQS